MIAPLPERARTILRMFISAAENGDPSPTNRFLGHSVGAGTTRVAEAVALLEALGLISIERGRNWRIVTICETGKTTSTVMPKVGRQASTHKPNQSGPTAAVRALSHEAIRRRRADQMFAFAGHVADGVPVKEAGAIIGISGASATVMMRDLRLRYDGVAEASLKFKGAR